MKMASQKGNANNQEIQ